MSRRVRRRRAFTLIDLVVALSASLVLVGGLSSTIYIAAQATSGGNAPALRLAGLECLAELQADLQFADGLSEAGPTAVTVTVADRGDADTAPETVRYAWTGVGGDPLTREQSGGGEAVVATDVHAFAIDYLPATGPVSYATVRLQIGPSPSSVVQTSIPLLNQP